MPVSTMKRAVVAGGAAADQTTPDKKSIRHTFETIVILSEGTCGCGQPTAGQLLSLMASSRNTSWVTFSVVGN